MGRPSDVEIVVHDVDEAVFMADLVDDLKARVVELVGGHWAYEVLDDAPLGDVPVGWASIPEALLAQTAAVAGLLDHWAVEFFFTEVRTI